MAVQSRIVEVTDLVYDRDENVGRPVPGGNVTAFRSNIRDDHYVVAMNTPDSEDDAATLRYVNLQQAVELRSMFDGIVEDLGGVGHISECAKAYGLGRDGEYKAVRQLMAETFGLDYDGKV